MKRTRHLTPYVYLLPHGVFFFLFVVVPLFFGLFISLHKWGMFSGRIEFVGLKYYLRLFDFDFVRTQYYWQSIWATLHFVAFSVPLQVGTGLALAVFLNAHYLSEWPRVLFRTFFLLPVSLAVTVVAVIWRWMLLFDNGLVNFFLSRLGIAKVPWLTEQPGAWISIVLTTLWLTVGWNTIFLLMGLQQIPKSVFEAARIDGAGSWKTFCHVTLPNMKRILTFVTTIQIVASFNLFAQPQLMTLGGPERSTLPVMLQIYSDGFNAMHPRIGSGCAMAFMTGLIMLAFLLIQFRFFVRRSE